MIKIKFEKKKNATNELNHSLDILAKALVRGSVDSELDEDTRNKCSKTLEEYLEKRASFDIEVIETEKNKAEIIGMIKGGCCAFLGFGLGYLAKNLKR